MLECPSWSAALVVRLLVIENEGAIIILIPAVLGAGAVLLRTRSWDYLTAAVLTSLTAMVSDLRQRRLALCSVDRDVRLERFART